MIWVVFSLLAFTFSVLFSVLLAFDEWFSTHEFIEGLLVKLCLIVGFPFIFVAALSYELFISIKTK